jgi:hypothetical protein
MRPASMPSSFTFLFSVFRLIPRKSAALVFTLPHFGQGFVDQGVLDLVDHELIDFPFAHFVIADGLIGQAARELLDRFAGLIRPALGGEHSHVQRQQSSVKSSSRLRTTARSIAFSSSRTLPGQG